MTLTITDSAWARRRALLAAGLLAVVSLGASVPSVGAQSPERHSGTVVSVDPAARSLVMKELVQEGRPRQLVVRIPGGASVVVSDRVPDEQVSRFDAVFVDKPIDLRDIRPGDFVLIEGPVRGDTTSAARVTVTLRGTGGSSAAPSERSRP
jgi:hypothetical protein